MKIKINSINLFQINFKTNLNPTILNQSLSKWTKSVSIKYAEVTFIPAKAGNGCRSFLDYSRQHPQVNIFWAGISKN